LFRRFHLLSINRAKFDDFNAKVAHAAPLQIQANAAMEPS
jgi:hypothetical protein